jgi:hypothetical protein
MTEQEKSDLWRLRTQRLGVYHVALVDDVWRAKRYNQVTHILTADTADELADKVQSDYESTQP